LGVNPARIVGDAAAAARPAKANASVSAAHQCHLVESAGRAHHQSEAVVLDFVNAEFFAAFFFSALRFLVAVSSDLSACGSVLKALFSKLSRRP
jgi:hypothetical protein